MTRRQRYEAYLDSEHWQNLREQKFELDGRVCAVCASTSNIVCHHIRYRNLYDCTPTDLIVLCQPCHDTFHTACKHLGVSYKRCTTPASVAAVLERFYSNGQATRKRRNLKANIRASYTQMKRRGFCKDAIQQHIEELQHLLVGMAPSNGHVQKLRAPPTPSPVPISVRHAFETAPTQPISDKQRRIQIAEAIPSGTLITEQMLNEVLAPVGFGCPRKVAEKLGLAWPLSGGWHDELKEDLRAGKARYTR